MSYLNGTSHHSSERVITAIKGVITNQQSPCWESPVGTAWLGGGIYGPDEDVVGSSTVWPGGGMARTYGLGESAWPPQGGPDEGVAWCMVHLRRHVG